MFSDSKKFRDPKIPNSNIHKILRFEYLTNDLNTERFDTETGRKSVENPNIQKFITKIHISNDLQIDPKIETDLNLNARRFKSPKVC